MLHLVSSNEVNENSQPNCWDCQLFNVEFECCPIIQGVDYKKGTIARRCQAFRYTKGIDPSRHSIDDCSEDDSSIFDFFINGERNHHIIYPEKPLLPATTQEGVYWYKSPTNMWGCWILNESKKKLMPTPQDIYQAEKGWADKVYRSPVPLHDHECHKDLRSRICWYIDDEGWGQYVILLANEIGYLSYPKPK